MNSAWWIGFAFIWLLLFDVVAESSSASDGFPLSEKKLRLVMTLGAMIGGVPRDITIGDNDGLPRVGLAVGNGGHRNRKRNLVHEMFDQYGPYYTKRAYRMSTKSFWKLHKILRPLMIPSRFAVTTVNL